MTAYDNIVSLGGNCEVAQHWRRWSGVDTAYPFDWLITPFHSVEKLFKGRFAGMASFENMLVINAGRTVMCRHYGVGHHFLGSRLLSKIGESKRTLFIRSWRDDLDPGEVNGTAPDGLVRYDFAEPVFAIEQCVKHDRFDILFVNHGIQKDAHPRFLFHNIVNYNDAVDWSGSIKGWNEMFETYTR